MSDNYKPWIKRVAQVGLIAKALVYILFGWLILRFTYTPEGPVGLMEVMKFIINQDTIGRIAILVLSLGLFCYAFWKYAQMVHNLEDHNKNFYGYFIRFTWLGPLFFYLILGGHGFIQLYRWYFGSFQYGQNGSSQFMKFVQSLPGQWIIGFISLTLVINAFALFYLAFSGKYTIMLTGQGFHQRSPRLAKNTGLVGYCGYGLALLIMGFLLAMSIFYSDMSYLSEQETIFRFLIAQSWGKILLTIISIGTISYGIYFLLTAYYRWKTKGATAS